MSRPSLDDTMLAVTDALARRALCDKRQVGCVLTDRSGRVVGTGYNGRPRGLPNCDGVHTCQNECEGVHAESNALALGARDAATCYVTCAPCWHCTKQLVNTGITRIVCRDASTWEPRSAALWSSLGREFEWSTR